MPVDLGLIDAHGLYAEAVSRYETGLCSYEMLMTFALRLSLVLRAAGLPDPGITAVFGDETIAMSLEDKETRKSLLGHCSALSNKVTPSCSAHSVDNSVDMSNDGKTSNLTNDGLVDLFSGKSFAETDIKVGAKSVVSPGHIDHSHDRLHEDSMLSQDLNADLLSHVMTSCSLNDVNVSEKPGHSKRRSSNDTSNSSCDHLAVLDHALFQVLMKDKQSTKIDDIPLVHFKPPASWMIADVIKEHISEYPVEHESYTNLDDDKFSITSFVIYTSGTFDRRASLRVYTTFSDMTCTDYDVAQILDFTKRHTNELVKIKAFRRLATENITIHVDDDYTIMRRQSPNYFHASKLLRREVYQNLSVITSLHTRSTHKNYAINYTEYSGHPVRISGSAHPMYDIKGFAFDISRLKSPEATWSAEQLLNQSFVAKTVDLRV